MLARRFFRPVVRLSGRRFFPPAAVSIAAGMLPLVLCASALGAPARPAAKKPKLPEAKDIPLVTSDKVRLTATYYPSRKGKDAVPVVLLHMHKGSRRDYAELAPFLQAQGHAVLVPDLRGHGDSAQTPGASANLSDVDFRRMVTGDMEAVKDFLRDENNAGRLNIEKLCLVGAEMGASVALTWTQFDWSRRPVGNYKLGQDVKALVLISPVWSTPGLPLKPVLTNSNVRFPLTDPLLIRAVEKGTITFKNPHQMDLRREVSVLIVAGRGNSRAAGDARRLYRMLKPYHPDPPAKERAEKQDLYYGTLDTKLQGTKMLGVKGIGLEQDIKAFIEIRLVESGFPWQARKKNPYVQEK